MFRRRRGGLFGLNIELPNQVISCSLRDGSTSASLTTKQTMSIIPAHTVGFDVQ